MKRKTLGTIFFAATLLLAGLLLTDRLTPLAGNVVFAVALMVTIWLGRRLKE